MPNYRLEHNVPWRTILHLQKLHLESCKAGALPGSFPSSTATP